MKNGELSIESRRQRVAWKIPSLFQLTSEKLQSPNFCFADFYYFLKLFWRVIEETEFICITVHRLITTTHPVTGVSCEVGLKTRTGKDIEMYRQKSSRIVGAFFLERGELEENRDSYVPDGNLTVFCSMSVGEPSYYHPEEELDGLAKLKSDYRQLLEKEADSDTCLVVSGKEFRAHRCVLRARSTVFNAMFGHETAEKEKGQVIINDLNPDSFVHFLEYLYTGDVEACLSDDNVFGMYKAADKYDVPTLKSECVAHMLRTLSVDSFCEVMTLTLWHSEESLEQRVIEFFKENLQRIIVTAKWQDFIVSNGTAANELFIKALVPLKQ